MKKNQCKLSTNKENLNEKIGQVRIISGLWRGRKLPVLNVEGLRPTGDRVKETLFNWLMGEVSGTVALDCFAGSGSLGFEALSRNAETVVFLEKDPRVAKQLQANLQTLKTEKGKVICIDSLQYLSQKCIQNVKKFDLVFIDPPFHFNLVSQTLVLLEQNNYLNNNALVYVETEKDQPLILTSNWQALKEKIAGQVCYRLYRYCI